jgi:hypothetical protein
MMTCWQEMSQNNKLRLLIIYVVTHAQKLDMVNRLQWMKVSSFC